MRNKQVMVKTLRDPSLIALHVAIPSYGRTLWPWPFARSRSPSQANSNCFSNKDILLYTKKKVFLEWLE